MIDESKYLIKPFYQGGYSTFDPNKGETFTGYHVKAGGIGMATDPRTANQLQEISTKLNVGTKTIEMSTVGSDVFESIPKQHFKEINRLAKLTGIKVTVHAPIVEPAGISKEGYSDTNRIGTERQMINAVEKAHEVNPDGNVIVTFHSSGAIPGEMKMKGKNQPDEVYVINTDSGAIAGRIPLKERFFPGEGEKGNGPSVKTELKKLNEEQWSQHKTQLSYNLARGYEYAGGVLGAVEAEMEKNKGNTPTNFEVHEDMNFRIGKSFIGDSYREFKQLYEQAYKQSNEEDRNKLIEFGKKAEEKVKQLKQIEKGNDVVSTAKQILLQKEIINDGLKVLHEIEIPETFQAIDEFARDKTATTFGNVAFESWKQFKDKSPIISIENPSIGGAFATGEDLKKVIEDSRKKFVEIATRPTKEGGAGLSESEAKKEAEKLIGATWDVGHVNMMRKFGYEGKDVVKQTEAIAPFVKHVHLSDNFGLDHTELPMGMGNVPMEEIMKRLGKEGFEGSKIIEAGNWFQHFKTAPFVQTLEGLGSPIYSSGTGPYWNQSAGLTQGYFGGYGTFLPQINYETFGGGFSNLPAELGGQRPGAAQGSRMSGKGME